METNDTTKLLYIGSMSAKYMLINGAVARVRPGDIVDTPNIFVEQRLKEGLWEKLPEELPVAKPAKIEKPAKAEKGGKE